MNANHKGMTVGKGTRPYFHMVTAGVDKEDLEGQQHGREGLLTGGAAPGMTQEMVYPGSGQRGQL